MATYTTLTKNDIDQLITPYDIGPTVRIEPMGGGQANSSFILTTREKRYVLSVCDEKNLDEIGILTSALNQLNRHGFITSSLIKTKGGETHIALDSKPVFLKEYVDGDVEENLTPEMLFQVGSALAELHEIPSFPGVPKSFSYGKECFPEVSERTGHFPGWLNALNDQFTACCPPDLPKGLIHGDLFYDNMLFEKGQLKAILDFEEICYYYMIFDLGMCAAGSCCIGGELSLELTAALIQGYQAKRPLMEVEKTFLKDHVAYGAAATAFWRYRQFNIIHPDCGKEDAYIPMMELTNNVNAIDTDSFRKIVFEK